MNVDRLLSKFESVKFHWLFQWKLTDLTVVYIFSIDESVKRQITDSISENFTDSDLESTFDFDYEKKFRYILLKSTFFQFRNQK